MDDEDVNMEVLRIHMNPKTGTFQPVWKSLPHWQCLPTLMGFTIGSMINTYYNSIPNLPPNFDPKKSKESFEAWFLDCLMEAMVHTDELEVKNGDNPKDIRRKLKETGLSIDHDLGKSMESDENWLEKIRSGQKDAVEKYGSPCPKCSETHYFGSNTDRAGECITCFIRLRDSQTGSE